MTRQDGVETDAACAEADRDHAVPALADACVDTDDRLAAVEPRREAAHRFRGPVALALVSAGVHVLVFATIFILSGAPPPTVAPQETAVEVVEEPPSEKTSGEAKPAPQQAADASQEPPERPPVKAEPAQAKEETKQEDAKQETKQQGAKRQEETKQEAKLDPSPVPKGAERPQKPPGEDGARLQALRDELATLKAQQAELQSQQEELEAQAQADAKAAAQAQAQAQAADRTKTLGLLPESFAAVTMPSVSPTGEDPVSYQQVVYSLVTKAKRSGLPYMKGVAHVVFDIDDKGALTRVAVDHSSGNPAVDKEAVALIRRAAPFPPPPAGAPRSFPSYMSFVPDP